MLRTRLASLTLVLIAAACGRSAPAPTLLGKVGATPAIASFEGDYDPATGQLTIRTGPPINPNGLTAFQPWQDGVPGSGPDNTLELVTESVPAAGFNPDGCGAGVRAFDGTITLRSFYRDQTFSNVYVELQTLTPSGVTVCGSATPVTGVSAQYGLWSYGSITPKGTATDHNTVTWHFQVPDNTQFHFTGRIMADLGAPAAVAGAPEFDWSPGSIVTPSHSFVEQPSTIAHITWNGTTFRDSKTGTTFALQGGPITTTSVGLWDPAQTYVSGFSSSAYYMVNDANAINTAGNFTACVKFKPGPHPTDLNPNRVLFGRGKPEVGPGNEGFALMQMHWSYCFHYRTALDETQGSPDVMSLYDLRADPSNHPENFTFDYICGGRNVAGNYILVDAHGRELPGASTSETSAFTSPASLPLVIGAYPDGTHAAIDQGVYEVIVDSRAATADVMNEIVSLAEGRQLLGPAAGAARTYLAAFADGISVTGADGGTYVEPPFATVPLAYASPALSDSSGLLTEGRTLVYTHPLVENTSTTGYCAGVQVTADAAWSAVMGGLLDVGQFFLSFNNFRKTPPDSGFMIGGNQGFFYEGFSEGGWASGSTHTFLACVAPGSPNNTISLYADVAAAPAPAPTPLASIATGNAIVNLSDPGYTLNIGSNGAAGTLTNARIGRVFFCPTSNPQSCL